MKTTDAITLKCDHCDAQVSITTGKLAEECDRCHVGHLYLTGSMRLDRSIHGPTTTSAK